MKLLISHILLFSLFFLPSLCFSNLESCEIGNRLHGKWVIEDPNNIPEGNLYCIKGRYLYYYFDAHLSGWPSCKAIIADIYSPKFEPCGVDVDPCGGIQDHYPTGENCCMKKPGARYIWECFIYSDPEPDKGAGPPCNSNTQCCF